jgi:X-X-X-Leu-X-X-Gly heptad repeat protein
MAADPLLAVQDEGRLNDAGLREAFVERVFAAARLRALLSGARDPAPGKADLASGARDLASGARDLASGARDLVEFHARHKLQLLAHDPARYRLAGRLVAAGGGAAEYRELFLAAITTPVTRGRNANALLHAYSRIGRTLSAPRRSDLVGRIDAYRRGEVPLSVPVALLAHYASGGDLPWLESQTFLAPYPAELRLRHAV